MLNQAPYSLNIGQTKDVTYGTISRPVSFRDDVTKKVSLDGMPFQVDQKYIFVSSLSIQFTGPAGIHLNLAYKEHVENVDGVMYLKYAMSFTGDYIGDFMVDAGSLNSLYEHNPSCNKEELKGDFEDIGNLQEISENLVALAHNLFMTGRVELRNLSMYDRNKIAYCQKLKHLAAVFGVLHPNYSFNFQGNMETLHGSEVQIGRLRMHADGSRPFVVWTTPKWVRGNGRGVEIKGRYSHEQQLDSFLELYPRHNLLPYTAAMVTRDVNIIPKIVDTIKAETASVNFQL